MTEAVVWLANAVAFVVLGVILVSAIVALLFVVSAVIAGICEGIAGTIRERRDDG